LKLNSDGSFTYIPKANFSGTDSFVYKAVDPQGGSQNQTVTLTVNGVNDAPDAVNDGPIATAYQTPVVRTAAQLLANDTDADGIVLTLVSVGNAVNGTVSLSNGTVTFTPKAGFSGNASYSYTVSDGQGGTDTATVSINVAAASGGSDGVKGYVAGTAAANDLAAIYNEVDGTHINAGAGNDVLRGGKFADWLVGGMGDDSLVGGAGGDQFRFFGTQIEGASDTDRLFDLNFAEGDTLVFNNFGLNTFFKTGGVNAVNGGTGAILDSYADIVAAAASSELVTAVRASPSNNNLIVRVTDIDGQVQELLISNGWSNYVTAGGTEGL
jgi:Ca2+-binding RTX toxin-like protein